MNIQLCRRTLGSIFIQRLKLDLFFKKGKIMEFSKLAEDTSNLNR